MYVQQGDDLVPVFVHVAGERAAITTTPALFSTLERTWYISCCNPSGLFRIYVWYGRFDYAAQWRTVLV